MFKYKLQKNIQVFRAFIWNIDCISNTYRVLKLHYITLDCLTDRTAKPRCAKLLETGRKWTWKKISLQASVGAEVFEIRVLQCKYFPVGCSAAHQAHDRGSTAGNATMQQCWRIRKPWLRFKIGLEVPLLWLRLRLVLEFHPATSAKSY